MEEFTLLAVVGLLGGAIGFLLGLLVGILRPGAASSASRKIAAKDPRRVEPRKQVIAAAPAKTVEPDRVRAVIQPAQMPQVPVSMPSQPGESITPVASLNPVNVFSRALQAEVKSPPPATRSIAAQIDEILQELIVVQPLSDGKPVRLLELPGKGLVVMVGLDQYDGVESVPSEEIRALIRQAVAIWEARPEDQE